MEALGGLGGLVGVLGVILGAAAMLRPFTFLGLARRRRGTYLRLASVWTVGLAGIIVSDRDLGRSTHLSAFGRF